MLRFLWWMKIISVLIVYLPKDRMPAGLVYLVQDKFIGSESEILLVLRFIGVPEVPEHFCFSPTDLPEEVAIGTQIYKDTDGQIRIIEP